MENTSGRGENKNTKHLFSDFTRVILLPPEAKGQNTFLLPGAGEGRFSSDRVLEGGDQVWLPFFTQGESITLLGTWRTIRKYVSNQRQMSSPHLSTATSAQSPRPVGALLISVE